MTIEERFERIEHVTAGIAEERRKDREEYRQLWRESHKRMDELNAAITRLAVETREKIEALAEQSRAEDKRLSDKIERLAEESRAEDRRLGERIESLVSAMGQFLARQSGPAA